MAYGEIKNIRQRLGDRLRFVYRHFPRPEHLHASHGAEAAEAAAVQGEPHFGACTMPCSSTSRRSRTHSWSQYAADIGLDTGRFSHDLGQHRHLHRIQ